MLPFLEILESEIQNELIELNQFKPNEWKGLIFFILTLYYHTVKKVKLICTFIHLLSKILKS